MFESGYEFRAFVEVQKESAVVLPVESSKNYLNLFES